MKDIQTDFEGSPIKFKGNIIYVGNISLNNIL